MLAFVVLMRTVLFRCFNMVTVIGMIMRIVVVLPVGRSHQSGCDKCDQPWAGPRQCFN
jgi:hypothetical protein